MIDSTVITNMPSAHDALLSYQSQSFPATYTYMPEPGDSLILTVQCEEMSVIEFEDQEGLVYATQVPTNFALDLIDEWDLPPAQAPALEHLRGVLHASWN